MASRGADTTTGAGNKSPGQREPHKKPPLSCTSCRARKLKCDKQDPCHNCVRSGSECVFPARKRIQRPRKTKNAELLQRLNRLETIVGKVGLTNLEAEVQEAATDVRPDPAARPRPHTASEGDVEIPNPVRRPYCSRDETRPPQDNTALRYLSGEFWSSLCDEVGGLKQALEQSTDSEDDDETVEDATPESMGGRTSMSMSPGMLLGTPQISGLQIEHPSPDHIRYLAASYFRNVDVHLKIIHRPTILNALYHLSDFPETASNLSLEREALFFAMYYAATTSLSSVECNINLGRPRADLSTAFQVAIERALVRADYLNSSSLETLQALTLYTCCLRSHNGSRASWALLGLPIRLAQALNIHQDGDGTHLRLSPYEAELRRRLWWQLIVLDIRAAEDRGTNTIIVRGSYNTRLPHNINDAEFGPDTTAPLQDRPGPSDVTFSLCTAQSSGISLLLEHGQGTCFHQSEEDVVRQARCLESQFVRGADPGHVGSYLASFTVRLIILKMWLVMRYPLHRRGGGGKPATLPPVSASDILAPFTSTSAPSPASSMQQQQHQQEGGRPPYAAAAAAVSRESTLRTAISVLELADFAQTGPYSDRFRWWSDMYVQWHPLAVALAELCTQTRGEAVEHAWRVVEDVFPRWSDKIADTKRGSLWRPIRKLYKKAKAAREAAATSSSSGRSTKTKGGSDAKTTDRGRPSYQQSSRPQAQQQQQPLGGLGPRVNELAIDPALSALDSSSRVPTISSEDALMRDPDARPRMIGDMILSESSAHSLNYTPPSHGDVHTNTSTSADFDPLLALASFPYTNMASAPPPSDVLPSGAAQSLAQSWLAWPDVSFDMPAMPPAPTPSTQPPPSSTSSAAMGTAGKQGGSEPTLGDPALLVDNNMMMDWSTWDEFVLDTYADSTPKSGGSEAS
ncbi:hypothetical protein F5Y19DRAFT_73912 [Xylariaceae sp. FL1651]|nr:hypothetical protein F5Y19DRAFT_73912 [Xylariaceae sp. FL1651]